MLASSIFSFFHNVLYSNKNKKSSVELHINTFNLDYILGVWLSTHLLNPFQNDKF